MTQRAAIVGGGVIGGGWLARFLLNGWDVAVFDPDPEAERKLSEVLANARRSLPGLYDVALPPEGQLRFCATLEEAVAGAQWIQESVPERLELKHRVLTQIQAVMANDAVIGSSTSGFKPSELGAGVPRPGRVLVAHPFNPVYLLPVVEVVPHTSAAEDVVAGALQTLRSIGMMPLRLRREMDAHVADRLLEAVWREALWLVKDDIATTQEIDDVIRFGFGIRWAQMGLFETYRIAGGEAGMAHFLAQFGPCLKWPWTRLTDVPDLDAALVEKISAQSDAQSGMRSIRELERIRDDNLVAMMRALKGRDWASGHTLREHDARLRRASTAPDWSQPVETAARSVPVDWTDYNGHMNESQVSRTLQQCDRPLHGTDRLRRGLHRRGRQLFHGGDTPAAPRRDACRRDRAGHNTAAGGQRQAAARPEPDVRRRRGTARDGRAHVDPRIARDAARHSARSGVAAAAGGNSVSARRVAAAGEVALWPTRTKRLIPPAWNRRSTGRSSASRR